MFNTRGAEVSEPEEPRLSVSSVITGLAGSNRSGKHRLLPEESEPACLITGPLPAQAEAVKRPSMELDREGNKRWKTVNDASTPPPIVAKKIEKMLKEKQREKKRPKVKINERNQEESIGQRKQYWSEIFKKMAEENLNKTGGKIVIPGAKSQVDRVRIISGIVGGDHPTVKRTPTTQHQENNPTETKDKCNKKRSPTEIPTEGSIQQEQSIPLDKQEVGIGERYCKRESERKRKRSSGDYESYRENTEVTKKFRESVRSESESDRTTCTGGVDAFEASALQKGRARQVGGEVRHESGGENLKIKRVIESEKDVRKADPEKIKITKTRINPKTWENKKGNLRTAKENYKESSKSVKTVKEFFEKKREVKEQINVVQRTEVEKLISEEESQISKEQEHRTDMEVTKPINQSVVQKLGNFYQNSEKVQKSPENIFEKK